MADLKTINPTQIIRLPIRASEIASVRVIDTDLVVVLKSGQRVMIRDGAMRAMIDTDLRIAFADSEIRAADLLKQVGPIQADTLSGLSVASKDAADASAAANQATPAGKPLDVMSSTSELNKGLTELLSKQQAQIESLTRQVETLSTNVADNFAKFTPPEASTLNPAAAKSGFLANINPAWGALGALGAAGGTAAAAATAVKAAASGSGAVEVVSLAVSGNVTLGPLLATNQLRVVAYDRNGNTLGRDDTVDGTTGAYSLKITNGYDGVIILKVIDGSSSSADYMDEATGTAKSLASNDLRAITVGNGTGTLTAHINPLTELVAVKVGLTSGSVTYSNSASYVLKVSKELAAKLEVNTSADQLMTEIAVVPTINVDGGSNAANANAIGKVLETISKVEQQNNYTTNQAVAAVGNQVTVSETAAPTFVDPTVTNLTTLTTTVLQTPPTIASVAFSADTGTSSTDLITNNNQQTLTLTLSKALTGARSMAWKTTDSSVWSSEVQGNATSTTLVFNNVVLGEGSKTLQFRITNIASGLTESAVVNSGVNVAYTLDFTAPTTPVLTGLTLSTDTGTSSTDFVTTSATQTISGTITTLVAGTDRLFGSVDGGATYQLITNRVTNTSSGQTTFTWAAPSLVNQNAAGTKSLLFQLVDVAGNTSVSSTAVTYVLDTTAPNKTLTDLGISADTGTADDFITATASQTITAKLNAALVSSPSSAAETLYGSTDGGANWTNINDKVSGTNIIWNNATLLTGANNIVFKIEDTAGNVQGGLGNQAYFLQTAPAAPLVTLAVDTAAGSATNTDRITRNGQFNVSNIQSGNTWEYSLNSGSTWTTGTPPATGTTTSSFVAPAGTYTGSSIYVRQTNSGGLVSATDFIATDITVDTSAAAPTLSFVDTANGTLNGITTNADGITRNGTITVSGLETGASWRYSTDGSTTWQTGGTVVAGSSSFALTGAGTAGTTYAANTVLVEQTDVAGNVSSQGSLGSAITVKTALPAQTLSGTDISADSGTLATGFYSANGSTAQSGSTTQNADFLTNTAAQTITATLSSALTTGDILYGRIGTDATWTALNSFLSTSGGVTTLNWTGRSLTGTSGAVTFQIVDNAGNVAPNLGAISYTVDTTAPDVTLDPGVTNIAFSSDSGSSSSDRITNASAQRIQTQLSRELVSTGTNTEALWASTNGGTSWTNITSYMNGTAFLDWNMSATSTTLTTGSNNLVFKVTDLAGNSSTIATVGYRYNPSVPTPTLTGQLDASSDTVGTLNGTTVGTTADGITRTANGLVYRGTVDAGAAVSVVINGVTYTTTANSTTGAYSITTNATALGNATYTPNVTITDLAGNTSTFAGTSFRVDTTANTKLPGETYTQLLGQLTAGQTSTTTGNDTGISSSDGITRTSNGLVYSGVVEAGAAVSVVINNVTYNTVANATTGAYSITTNATALADGTYTPLVTVTDLAGNTSTVGGTSFRVDTTANTKIAGETYTQLLGQLTQTQSTLTAGNDTGVLGDNLTNTTSNLTYSGVVEAGSAVSVSINGISYTATANASTGAYSITTNSTALADATYTPIVTVTDLAGNTSAANGTAFTIDTGAPTAAATTATYFANAQAVTGATTRTLVLNGSNFSTLLESGDTASTDIKARLDWSKLSYDFDGDNTAVDGSTYTSAIDGKTYGSGGAFTVNDIESAFVTNGTTLTIKLTAAKARALETYNDFVAGDYFGEDSNANNAYWTSGAGAGKGNQADKIDVLAGFFLDKAGNASSSTLADGAVSYAAPVQNLALGTSLTNSAYGRLIAPVVVAVNTGTLAAPVWVNKTFYYWDLSGNGSITNTQANGSNYSLDTVNHNFLDGLFYRDANFANGTAGADTTSAGYNSTDFRYGDLTTFNNIQLALATGAVTGETLTVFRAANAEGNQRSDLTAIWDQFNTGMLAGATNGAGTPTGWANGGYWSATSTGAGTHVYVDASNGFVFGTVDTSSGSAALQLVTPTPTVSGVTYYGNYANEANFTNGTTRTMVLNGTNFDQLLDTVNSGDVMGAIGTGTNIKSRLDWTKFTYDYDSNSTAGIQSAAEGKFSLSDIESATVTSSNTLAIRFTAAKITSLEAYSGDSSGASGGVNDAQGQVQRDYFGEDSNANNSYWLTNTGAGRGLGNQADGIDIVNGFFKDVTGNVVASNTVDNAAITYAAPVQSISLGTYGQLIAPTVVAVNTGTLTAPVWVNKTFYYWDLSGNGSNTNTQANGSSYSADTMTHDFLDGLFYRNSSFTGGTAGTDTTSAGYVNATTNPAGTNDFRYGDLTTFNNFRLALATGAVTGDTMGFFRAANAQGNQRSDLTAIWDQFNTLMATGATNAAGVPTGWAGNAYWSATSTGADTHVIVSTSIGYVGGNPDTTGNYAALQVL